MTHGLSTLKRYLGFLFSGVADETPILIGEARKGSETRKSMVQFLPGVPAKQELVNGTVYVGLYTSSIFSDHKLEAHMNIKSLVRQAQRFTADHSPEILTAIGVAGTLTTAYLSYEAGLKVHAFMENEDPQMPLRDELELTWRFYIPPVASATLTVVAIIGAAHVNNRRAAAMATAYTISERAFQEYKEKVIQKVGEKKEQAFRDEIAQERVERDPLEDNTVIITGGGDVLCYDRHTGRYFMSSMEQLKQAEITVNYMILHDGYASLSDLYYELGIPTTRYSEEVGWNTDTKLKMMFSAVLADNDKPCIAIDFDLAPRRKYSHYAP